MSLILHLSDLHLGNIGHADDVGDYYKTETIVEKDRVTRAKLLQETLKAVAKWLVKEGKKLDAVVISGDVTTRGLADGFGHLPELLNALGDKLPHRKKILVVPGNHDVNWTTDPGSMERYKAFIDGVRRIGYTTPLLDGVDYVDDKPKSTRNPIIVGDDFLIFAVNSADHCGVVEPLPEEHDKIITRLLAAKEITPDEAKKFRELQMYDMPRIQPRQMAALADLIAGADNDGRRRVRIAAVHHQLLPVRQEEEVKPFESIVNLAAFTEFLADCNTDLVLHGHKHAAGVQEVPIGSADTHRVAVVCSCGTIGGQIGVGYEVAKLISIDSRLPTVRTVQVSSVPALGSGQTSLTDKIKQVHRGQTWTSRARTRVTVIDGESAGNVHEHLLALSLDLERPSRDLICVLDDGASALEAPSEQLWKDGPKDPIADWFHETVDWWQDATPGKQKPFTHGQRLRAWPGPGGEQLDQIDAISRLLSDDPGTSRGVAVLVDPARDAITNKTQSFPSFSLLHIWIEADRLHCSAFFRKQEMKYWWRVNVAEIATIQRNLINSLHASNSGLTAGSIRTHTTEAVFSDQLPKVSVPRIDRRFWKDEASVRVLALAIADEESPGRAADIKDFLDLMNDWEPSSDEPPADGAPVPGPGLAAIAELLDKLADRHSDASASSAAKLLRQLEDHNNAYLAARDGSEARTAYMKWRGKVQATLTELRSLLTRRRAAPRKAAPAKAPSRRATPPKSAHPNPTRSRRPAKKAAPRRRT